MKTWRAQLLLLVAAVGIAPLIPAGFALRSLLTETARPLLGSEMKAGVDTALDLTRELMEAERQAFVRRLADGADVDTLGSRLSDADSRMLDALGLQPGEAPVRVELDSGLGFVARVSGETDPTEAGAWVFSPLSPRLVDHSRNVESAVRRMESFRRDREAWLSSALGAFFIVELGILAVALALGFLLARRLTEPITALESGIERVAQGDLDTSIRPRGNPELRVVLERFNRMVLQLRSQQAELLRLEKQTAWQQMARSLAHEIKNPLTPIQLASEEVHNAYRGDDEGFRTLLDESTKIIEEEIGRLRELVAGFSQLAKPATSSHTVDLAELVSDLGRIYGDKIEIEVATETESVAASGTGAPSTRPELTRASELVAASGIAEASEDAPIVRGDREALRRVLLNLVNNGLQAHEAAQRIEPVRLRLQASSVEVRIIVSDHGEGVPMENRTRIFEPDFTTRSDGIGLGLAIARSTAEGHGGTLELAATNEAMNPAIGKDPGDGATFVLTLPRRNGDAA